MRHLEATVQTQGQDVVGLATGFARTDIHIFVQNSELRRKETDPAALDARGLSPLDVSIATNNVIASQMLISRLPKERRSAIRLTQKVRSFLRKKKQIHK